MACESKSSNNHYFISSTYQNVTKSTSNSYQPDFNQNVFITNDQELDNYLFIKYGYDKYTIREPVYEMLIQSLIPYDISIQNYETQKKCQVNTNNTIDITDDEVDENNYVNVNVSYDTTSIDDLFNDLDNFNNNFNNVNDDYNEYEYCILK